MKVTKFQKILEAFTCKDESRSTIAYPWVQGNYVYATNGHAMVRMEKALLGLPATHPDGFLALAPPDDGTKPVDAMCVWPSDVDGMQHRATVDAEILAIAKGKRPVVARYLNSTVNGFVIAAGHLDDKTQYGIDLRLLNSLGESVLLRWNDSGSGHYFMAMIDDTYQVDGVVMPTRI